MLEIPKPPWTGVGRRIESQTRKALFDYSMIEGQERIAIALSGGKDSMTLLFMLKAILGRGVPDAKLFAIYIGGTFSCGASVDNGYLQKICDELEVEFIYRETKQEEETLSCYPCSRERRRLLFEAAKEAKCSHIAFGHHSDDNAQTLLMNLFHKGEFAGMLPKVTMENYGVTIIRPLIYAKEADIKNFALKGGFVRARCRCPVGQNSIRKKADTLLKDIEDVFPNARNNVASASLVYGSDKAATP